MHWSRLRRFALLAAGLVLLPAPAGALITLGRLGLYNPGTALVVEDGLAYIASYGGIFIVDVSDPSEPVEIGVLDGYWPERLITVRDLAVEGELAYLAVVEQPRDPSLAETGSLIVVDVSDPTAPVEIGAFELPTPAIGIAVVDDLAYLTVRGGFQFPGMPPPYPEIEPPGLRVIDIANPSAPVQVGKVEFISGPDERNSYPTQIDVVGDLAYIADAAGLRTVDVSDPKAPVAIDLAASSGPRPNSLSVADGFAYVTGGPSIGPFSVFDLSDPKKPIEIASLPLSDGGSDVSVEGKIAYVAAADAGLQAIDISNPEAPVALGRLATPYGSARALTTANGLAYVLSRTSLGDLVIVDLELPTTPIEVGSTTVSGMTYSPGVAVAGGLAYITIGEEGVQVVDVSNPATPVGISTIDTPGYAAGATAVNGVAYIADGEAGLRIVDVAKPAVPVEISAIDTPGFAAAVEVVNGLAYVADSDAGLRVIDVSNPEAPVEVGAIDTIGAAVDVVVVGELAYVVDYFNGLRIIDVSNPEQPVELSALDTPSPSRGIAVSGGRAYLATVEAGRIVRAGLRIIDVSDPRQPVELGAFIPSDNLRIYWEVWAVAVVGEIAYLGTQQILAVDVSDPTVPVEVGAFDIPGFDVGFDLVVADGLIYSVRPTAVYDPEPALVTELMIVDFGPEYAPKLEISVDIKASINPARRGVVPVAILGSESFDVANIDRATLKFGPNGATPAHSRGGHPADTNGDGTMDLVSHFRVQQSGITSETERVCVSGQTLDGVAFEGCSAIRSQP